MSERAALRRAQEVGEVGRPRGHLDQGTPAAHGSPFRQVTTASRPDVHDGFPAAGPDQGCQVEVPMSPGAHRVCAHVIDRLGTPGATRS